ncbi:MAG: hypothetical protein MUF78_11070, partial [Candidatus Edwardsbacteria bacterium]|nr:hypothetical protein [Candidatus Edwardsbacteria bacterium]
MQHAVDPQADHRLVALGLDVDVRGPLVEGVVEQVLDGAGDVLVRRLDLGLALELDVLLQVAEVVADLALGLGGLDRGLEAVELADDLDHVRLGGQRQPD